MNNRPGCLSGLLQLTLLNVAFDWLQDHFGFGKGASCSGCGCGCLFTILFIMIACSIITGTDWFRPW